MSCINVTHLSRDENIYINAYFTIMRTWKLLVDAAAKCHYHMKQNIENNLVEILENWLLNAK